MIFNDILFNIPEECPPVVVKIFDSQTKYFIGWVTLRLKQEDIDSTHITRPIWQNIRFSNRQKNYNLIKIFSLDGSDHNNGRIFLSLNAYSNPQNSRLKDTLYSLPALKPFSYSVNIRILGVRNLQSLGLMPVKRPYVAFDLDSVKDSLQKVNVVGQRFIKTEPVERGANANMLTVLK